jgi:hypothetical protein
MKKKLFRIVNCFYIALLFTFLLNSCKNEITSPGNIKNFGMSFTDFYPKNTISAKILKITGSKLKDSLKYVTIGNTKVEIIELLDDSVKVIVPLLASNDYEIKGFNEIRSISLFQKIKIDNNGFDYLNFYPTDIFPSICSPGDTLTLFGGHYNLLKNVKIYFSNNILLIFQSKRYFSKMIIM